MAFNDIEISEFYEPVELFKFSRGVANWYYTSSDIDIDFGGNTYLAEPIQRSKIVSTQEIGKTTLKINMSIRNVFANQFIEQSPTDIIRVEITRFHTNELDPATTFRGRLVNVEFAENEIVLTCQPSLSSLRRPGLRKLYQTACPHVLYGAPCSLSRNTFAVETILTAVNGLVLSSGDFNISIDPTYDATWFSGGFIELNQGGLINRRFITDHDNASGAITINLPLSGAVVGASVTAFPGCDHSPATCHEKFNNILNYGGFPYIPQKNPMNGTSVF